MFNIGFAELIVLSIIALFVIGPKQLPQVARAVGRMLNELRRATDDITGSFTKATAETRNDLHKDTLKILEVTGKTSVPSSAAAEVDGHDHDHHLTNEHLEPQQEDHHAAGTGPDDDLEKRDKVDFSKDGADDNKS